MKVLSIKQPWASLIIQGYKKYEFRTWKTKYRGELYIHVSKKADKEALKRFENMNLSTPVGCIIGKVNIVDCEEITKEFEDKLIKENNQIYGYSGNREGYAWIVTNPTSIEPIYINGKLGIWEYKK